MWLNLSLIIKYKAAHLLGEFIGTANLHNGVVAYLYYRVLLSEDALKNPAL